MSFASIPEPLRDVVDAPELAFPLAQRYRRRVLPLIIFFAIALVGLSALSLRQVIREIEIDFAARRATELVDEVKAAGPSEWRTLLAGKASPEQQAKLTAILSKIAAEERLTQLTVYTVAGEVLFSTEPGEAGQVQDSAALSAAGRLGEPMLQSHGAAGALDFNQFYVPVKANSGDIALVIELHLPAGGVRSIVARALVLPVLIPGLLFVTFSLLLGALIGRGQAGINVRAVRVRELSVQLQGLMSSIPIWTKDPAQQNGDSAVPLRRIEVSLLYSDVRRFTEFAESASPGDVVGFLNRVMTLQAEFVANHGGAIDKLMGDALLVRFEGPEKERRALAAALDVQTAVEGARLPRGLGIGIFTGPVISGGVGPMNHREHMVIGDSVQVAVRLSAKAKRGVVLADARTLARSGMADRFAPSDEIKVKGRGQPIEVGRWSVEESAAGSSPPAKNVLRRNGSSPRNGARSKSDRATAFGLG
jgi:class 3 adenylate cyclase